MNAYYWLVFHAEACMILKSLCILLSCIAYAYAYAHVILLYI